MKNKTGGCALLLLAVATGLLAQTSTPSQFSGVIHDYSPATTVTPMGPWEMRGSWTLTLDGTGKGDFSAALTMELSDYTRNSSNVDATSGADSRMQHTHNITIQGGTVAQVATGGFELTGPASITKDGGPSALPGVYIICHDHRGKDRRVFEHHAAIPRWRTGSFRAAVDPRCRYQPDLRLCAGYNSGSDYSDEQQLQRNAFGHRYDPGLGSRIFTIGRKLARVSKVRISERRLQRNRRPLLLGFRLWSDQCFTWWAARPRRLDCNGAQRLLHHALK